MKRREEDPEIEHRIIDEAVVDAHDREERAMGWYYYLEDQLLFPFEAVCCEAISTSPFKKGQRTRISKMADIDVCSYNMFVTADFGDGTLDIPLGQVAPTDDASEETIQAIGDWHYWCERGYEF